VGGGENAFCEYASGQDSPEAGGPMRGQITLQTDRAAVVSADDANFKIQDRKA